MTSQTPAYRVGDIVTYRVSGNELRTVRIEERDSDMKNGLPGFYGVVLNGKDKGLEAWGYDVQIERVKLCGAGVDVSDDPYGEPYVSQFCDLPTGHAGGCDTTS